MGEGGGGVVRQPKREHGPKLIIAALRLGRGDKVPTPRLMSLAFQCQRWQALPEPGGVLDQPAGMLETMGTLLNVYEATRSYANALDPTKWAGANPSSFELYAWARDVEKKHVN